MKRNRLNKLSCSSDIDTYKKRIAVHEAGHAVAIFLNNKIKNLPPVYFQISFNDDISHDSDSLADVHHQPSAGEDYSAQVDGGRLINNFADSLEGFIGKLDSNPEKQEHCIDEYLLSFEADIVNLLIGPLAEAKLVALTDGEDFHKNLIYVDALQNYGGSSDLTLINKYLENFSACKNEQNQKLAELHTQAFNFVDNYLHWEKIIKLTDYIIENNIKTIDYNEIDIVLNEQKTAKNSYYKSDKK